MDQKEYGKFPKMIKPTERVTPLAEWEAYSRETVAKPREWKPNTRYEAGDIVDWQVSDPPRKRKMTWHEYFTWAMVIGIIIVLGSWVIVMLVG